MAFYLKYRPQSLDQLIGQEAVKKVLSSAFLANKLSHAYLFVGPRGTGKTSTARILAKMVNCEMNVAGSVSSQPHSGSSTDAAVPNGAPRSLSPAIPCNKCSICLSITDGSNLDLIEIDAASNRGIDDIRSLREKVKLAPLKAKKKVYIIDEVHMLTTEAFNALLKTLEEPPVHALFILATTDSAKMPQTILSRVQRLDFKLASNVELLEAFKKIVEEEKLQIDVAGLQLLAKRSEGSFRDGIKLLDQISSIEGKITVKELEGIIRSGQTEDILQLLDTLSKKDAKASLLTLHKILENGADLKILTISLMDFLRNIVFMKNGLGESLVEPQYSEEDYSQLKSLSGSFSNQDLILVLDLLQESLEKLKFASIQSLPLELVIVEVCGEGIQTIDDRKLKIEIEDRSLNVEKQEEIHPQSSIIENLPSTLDHPSSNSDILKLKEKWNFVLETVRPYNFSLEALLRSINISECTQTAVYIEVPYSFHQRILEVPKNRDILEAIISDILGRPVKISTVLGVRPQRKEDVANIEIAADDEIIRAAAEIFNSDVN